MELKVISFKSDEGDREIMDRLSTKLGITRTDVIKIAIRRLDTLEQVIDKVKLPRYKKEG